MSCDPIAPLTVYFDGQCPVCSREIALYRRLAEPGAIAWVDATAAPDAALGADLSRTRALARLHVRTADGRLESGARAFVMLWRHVPRTASLARILAHRPLLALLEVGYRLLLVARRAWRRGAP